MVQAKGARERDGGMRRYSEREEQHRITAQKAQDAYAAARSANSRIDSLVREIEELTSRVRQLEGNRTVEPAAAPIQRVTDTGWKGYARGSKGATAR